MIGEVVLVVLYVSSGEGVGNIFTHMADEDDFLLQGWFENNYPTSRQECALLCNSDQNCFYFSHINDNCHLFTHYDSTSTTKRHVLGMKTYEKNCCPSMYIRVGDTCLRFSDTAEDNDGARSRCLEENAHLLSIATDSKFEMITNFIADNGMYRLKWSLADALARRTLGATIEAGQWAWPDGSSLDTNSMLWCPGEPSHGIVCMQLFENRCYKDGSCVDR
ncbi:attractin-like [Haliotis asinina]|uniref:attractin-like n=1 Tax=Haliotis asinina TaxID=109174 RepID=UPI0035320D3D